MMPEEDPFEKELREFYARELREADKRYPVTDADMQRVRDLLGSHQQRGRPPSRLAVGHVLRTLCRPAAVSIMVVLGILIGGYRLTVSHGISMKSARTERGDLALPSTFTTDLREKIQFLVNSTKLAGTLTRTNSQDGLTAFVVRVQGRDKEGIEARIQGLLWLTNSPGKPTIARQADVSGALLDGIFEIVGRSTKPVHQDYVP